MTTTATLHELNVLRAAQGMSPLKSWKASRAALEAAIAKLGPRDVIETKSRPNKMKDVGTPPIVPRKAKATSSNTLTEFCAHRKINVKVARAKLRRAGLKGPYTLTAEVIKIVTNA